jgi:hypothetical protein
MNPKEFTNGCTIYLEDLRKKSIPELLAVATQEGTIDQGQCWSSHKPSILPQSGALTDY